jgi:uncharacterized repeat protein (TIGR04138 family)
MADISFEEAVERSIVLDPRYKAPAYEFVRDVLHIAVKKLRGGDEGQHVSGQELLGAMKDMALTEYGPMAKIVLNQWGLHKGDDVGMIVYNLIEVGYFGRSDGDTLEDFSGGYDFDDAFTRPYLPKSRQAGTAQI